MSIFKKIARAATAPQRLIQKKTGLGLMPLMSPKKRLEQARGAMNNPFINPLSLIRKRRF